MTSKAPDPVVYLAGRMTGMEDYNFPAFNEAAQVLRLLGFTVRNPAENPFNSHYVWEDYLEMDLYNILASDGVVCLPGWEKSRGATFEVYIANTLGKAVLRYDTLMPIGEKKLRKLIHRRPKL